MPIAPAGTWKEFERGFLFPRQPLCIRSSADESHRLKRWHPRDLTDSVGHREVPLPNGSVIDLPEYVDALLRNEGDTSHTEPSAPDIPCLTHVAACETFQELQAEEWIPPLARPNWLERWELRGLVPDF